MSRLFTRPSVLKRDIKPPTCNVCNGALTPRFGSVRDPITNESFAILSCTGCGLGHTFPPPDNLGRYYGNHYYGRRHGLSSRYYFKRSLRILARIAQETSGRRLLDVGCGDGSFMLGAKEAGWRVMGTELHPSPARALGLDVRGDIEEIDDAGRFDCITMWHSLEHMRDIKSTLFRLSILLHKKGRLLIAIPDNWSWQASLFGPRWIHLDVPRHLYHFDRASLNYCLAQAGFSVQRFCHRELEHDLMGWSQSTLNCVSPIPNVFLDFLMGKGKRHPTWTILSHVMPGLLLTAAYTPLVSLDTFLSKSATVIALACRRTS
jgi:SAM-dependent methyltransferase